MAEANSQILIYGQISQTTVLQGLTRQSVPMQFQSVGSFFDGIGIGSMGANLQLYTAATYAMEAATATANPSPDDTIIIAGQTITFVASGATGLQVNIGGNQGLTNANLAALINSDSHFVGIISAATAPSEFITFTALVPGPIGNGIQVGTGTAPYTFANPTLSGGSYGSLINLRKGI